MNLHSDNGERSCKNKKHEEIIPLKEITEKLVKKAETDGHRSKLEELLHDLNTLECVLNKIIKMEEKNARCLKGDNVNEKI